ncbi:MAG TPA: beta-ketoacyl synthase N-terminal-like domain-containing protein [Candidatus Binatia bacterium]|nr:beta-ketoacyl synthase N-terminal-like domain-containing protein [Candidatus Binatia bacterium]
MQPVYVSGVGMTKFGKDPRPLLEIFCQAGQQALAGSKEQDVEAIYVGVMNPEEFTGDSNIASQITEALGLTGIPAVRIETASSAGAAAIQAGFQAIASGYYRRVLILGGEKMTHLSTSATTRILAEVIDKQERQCGATMSALAAMITEKYRQKFRLSHSTLENMLCAVALKNHLNGSRNPLAQFQRAITREAYLASKLIATPLRLYDCSPITDGAAAVILTSEKTDVRLSGIGQGTGPVSLRERDVFTSFPATRIAAARAYQMAETSPRDIDFAEVHDAFTPFEIISTEDLGFFAPGKGGEAVIEGKTALEGPLPINPSGGLKARGHPVGASGLAQIVEATKRLRGQSQSKRQFKRGLTQSTGGLGTNNFVTILERADLPMVQNPGVPWSAPAPGTAGKKATRSRAISDEGQIETFTIVYVTPDGFLPPLALALIRDRNGGLVMAQGEDTAHLKIGREVYLRRLDDFYLFTVKSQLQKVQESLKRLLRRGAASPAREESPTEEKL